MGLGVIDRGSKEPNARSPKSFTMKYGRKTVQETRGREKKRSEVVITLQQEMTFERTYLILVFFMKMLEKFLPLDD